MLGFLYYSNLSSVIVGVVRAGERCCGSYLKFDKGLTCEYWKHKDIPWIAFKRKHAFLWRGACKDCVYPSWFWINAQRSTLNAQNNSALNPAQLRCLFYIFSKLHIRARHFLW